MLFLGANGLFSLIEIVIDFWLQIFGRIRTLVLKPEALRTGISASDAAMALGIAPAMAKEHLLAAEGKGMIN